MKAHILIVLLLAMAVLQACDLPVRVPSSGGADATFIPPTLEGVLPSAAQGLTLEQLRNMEYFAPAYQRQVQLVGGIFQAGADSTSPDYLFVNLLEFVAYGDLNGDGVDDVAVLLAENGGGSGTFVSLIAVVNNNGVPFQAAYAFVDDRPMIMSIGYSGGEIILDAVVHGFEDPMCCPDFRIIQTFGLESDQLTRTSLSSKTPGGLDRVITISAPLNSAEATGSVQLIGSVTISPFENNLAYRIYDLANNELAAGPVMVSAPDMGAPGTFDVSIPLTGIPAGAIRIELQELSMRDGSLETMDSVLIIVK